MIWKKISNKLNQDIAVYLLVVIESKGSAPGRRGFKMMVSADGEIHGSIGGGVMEYNLVEEARKMLQEKKITSLVRYQVHRKESLDSSGMICSGEQQVAFLPLSNAFQSDISAIMDAITSGERMKLIMKPNSLALSPLSKAHRMNTEIKSDTEWLYEEVLNDQPTICLFGGGHVGLACSKIFHLLGFKVILYDNRAELNALQNEQCLGQIQLIDYNHILAHLPAEKDIYIAIMTTKYTEDMLILEQLFPFDYVYVGVLGSRAKVKNMFAELQKKGFGKAILDTLYAPIGHQINSQTPTEIAVSIASEIIELRNSR